MISVAVIGVQTLGAERPAFQTLRYNEDWSSLYDSSRRTDWLDPVKFIPLVAWQAGRHLNLMLNYVAYLFGDFVKESLPAQRNGNYLSAVATFRF